MCLCLCLYTYAYGERESERESELRGEAAEHTSVFYNLFLQLFSLYPNCYHFCLQESCYFYHSNFQCLKMLLFIICHLCLKHNLSLSPKVQHHELVLSPSPSLFFFLFRATPMACGSSQARSRIRATPAGLHHSHSQCKI